MFLDFFLSFLVGLSTKFADNLTDEPFLFSEKVSYIAALAYGLIGGFLISSSSEFATLFLAIIVAVLFAGKIDNFAHQLGFLAIFASIAFFGLPPVILPFFALLAISGFLDEVLNNFAGRRAAKGIAVHPLLLKVVGGRLLLEASCFGIGIATGNWVYFLAILLFDSGYFLSEKAMHLLFKPSKFFPIQRSSFNCFECDSKKLASQSLIRESLNNLVELLSMKKICEETVVKFKADKEGDSGISGFVVIAESHISVHSWPKRLYLFVDILSCRPFDSSKVQSYLENKFDGKVFLNKIDVKTGFRQRLRETTR